MNKVHIRTIIDSPASRTKMIAWIKLQRQPNRDVSLELFVFGFGEAKKLNNYYLSSANSSTGADLILHDASKYVYTVSQRFELRTYQDINRVASRRACSSTFPFTLRRVQTAVSPPFAVMYRGRAVESPSAPDHFDEFEDLPTPYFQVVGCPPWNEPDGVKPSLTILAAGLPRPDAEKAVILGIELGWRQLEIQAWKGST